MGYKKVITKHKEYSGESFSQTISKGNSKAWLATDIASYVLVGPSGILVDESQVQIIGTYGDLVKSADSKLLSFVIPTSVTQPLVGVYKVIVDLKDSSNASISDVIAEYDITYKARTA